MLLSLSLPHRPMFGNHFFKAHNGKKLKSRYVLTESFRFPDPLGGGGGHTEMREEGRVRQVCPRTWPCDIWLMGPDRPLGLQAPRRHPCFHALLFQAESSLSALCERWVFGFSFLLPASKAGTRLKLTSHPPAQKASASWRCPPLPALPAPGSPRLLVLPRASSPAGKSLPS